MRWLLPFGVLAIAVAAACGESVTISFNTPTPQAARPTETPVPIARVEPTQIPTQPARMAAQISADIANFRHQDLAVAVGVSVTWTNKDNVPHTVTAGAPGAESGVFDSGVINQGGSFSFTFDREGTFPYFCKIHTSMQGTVTVTLSGGVDTGEAGERIAAATAEAEKMAMEATAETEKRTMEATVEAEKRVMEATAETENRAMEATAETEKMAMEREKVAEATAMAMEKEKAMAGPQVAAEIKSSKLPDLVIEVGTTVTWTNADPIPHTASAGTPVEPTRFFESLSLNPGLSYSFTFTETGEYPYFCRVHPRTMQAVVKVVTADEKARMERETTPTPVAEATPRAEPTVVPEATATPEPTREPEPTATAESQATGRVSEIKNFTLEDITISVGSSVTWTNNVPTFHTASAVGGTFESGALSPGQAYTFTFNQVGSFPYFCQFHAGMTATVTVTGG